MASFDEHFDLVERAVKLHNQFKYAEALPFLRRAYSVASECPSTIYNLANTLHMLGEDAEASELLLKLTNTTIECLEHACPDSDDPAESYQVDAHFLLFKVLIGLSGDWGQAYPYAEVHLRLRREDLVSCWSTEEVLADIEELHTRAAGAGKEKQSEE